jgi:hypothetical protein
VRGGSERCIQNFGCNIKGGLGELGLGVRIISKWILRK